MAGLLGIGERGVLRREAGARLVQSLLEDALVDADEELAMRNSGWLVMAGITF